MSNELQFGKEDLVLANHILAQHGVLDGFGHVSMRSPDNPAHYFLSRSLAPELVTQDDIIEFNLDSEPLNGDARRLYLERFIHGEIYKRRPDVQSIVHSHSPSVIPFAASSVRLRPIYHMAGFLTGGAPIFDIKTKFGCTDLLVTCGDHGHELSKVLGDANVSLMRGHGFVAVGSSVAVAVYRAIYTELNASLQEKAINLGGDIIYLEEEEGEKADASIRGVMHRPWELWKKKVARPGKP